MTSASAAFDYDTAKEARPHAPTPNTLVQILQEHRAQLLTELRDTEQTIEQLEANPTFEGTFQRVSKILNRGKLR